MGLWDVRFPTDGGLSESLIPRFMPLIGGELNLLYLSFGSQFLISRPASLLNSSVKSLRAEGRRQVSLARISSLLPGLQHDYRTI